MTIYRQLLLRKTLADDLPVLFTFQLDEDANHLAAFTSKDPTDKVISYRCQAESFVAELSFGLWLLIKASKINL